jgi:hypothetical protein
MEDSKSSVEVDSAEKVDGAYLKKRLYILYPRSAVLSKVPRYPGRGGRSPSAHPAAAAQPSPGLELLAANPNVPPPARAKSGSLRLLDVCDVELTLRGQIVQGSRIAVLVTSSLKFCRLHNLPAVVKSLAFQIALQFSGLQSVAALWSFGRAFLATSR